MQPMLQWKSNKYYTFRKCVFVALGIQQAMRTLHTVICDLSGSIIFYHIISSMARFGGGGLLKLKHVFWFSVQLLYETFLILRRTEWDRIKNIYWLVFM